MTGRPQDDGIPQQLRRVIENIGLAARRAGREASVIRLIVVTKGVPVEKVGQAVEAGARDLGESRLQEALPKVEALQACQHDLTWHFIGRLQRNKVRAVVGTFDIIHSVDSLMLAGEIDRRARASGVLQRILLEVNLGEETSKGGFSPSAVEETLPTLDRMSSLQVEGLMAIPPFSPDPEAARPYFRNLRGLAQKFAKRQWARIRMHELSMGMSHDYEIAVEEGATMVRVGSAIFGERKG